MFDIGWQELFLIAVLALIVIGPKDLPRALKTITGLLRKAKGMARDFQSGLDDIVRETELADMRKQIEGETGGDIRKRIEETLDPDGEISRDLDDVRSVENDMSAATKSFSDEVNRPEPDVKPEPDATLPDPNDAMIPSPPPPPAPAEPQTSEVSETPSPAKKD
tara:strand:- start:28242 stop:28733 length:492 start_codon:yes stop_codon:yes gene_type:complete